MKKKCLVLGGGISGVGTAQLAIKEGFDVYVSDSGQLEKVTKDKFKKWGVIWEENVNETDLIKDLVWVMKSPGIPNDSLSVLKVKKLGIPILSEIEFASRCTNAKIIGITGSNGKTTTSELTYHILKNSGLNVGIAGNIGTSFAQQVAEYSFEIYVLELSSFQLDDIIDFAPDIAVITNITPDHLERYNYNFNDYVASKLKITLNQSNDQFLLLNANDSVLMEAVNNKKIAAKKHLFGFDLNGGSSTSINNNNFLIKHENSNTMISASIFPLKGRHNLLNAMAGLTVASILKLSKNNIRESLLKFKLPVDPANDTARLAEPIVPSEP